jgi:hypothetical protein
MKKKRNTTSMILKYSNSYYLYFLFNIIYVLLIKLMRKIYAMNIISREQAHVSHSFNTNKNVSCHVNTTVVREIKMQANNYNQTN